MRLTHARPSALVDVVADGVEVVVDADAYTIQVPSSGILSEVYFDEGESVERDEVLCAIDEEDSEL